MANIYSMVDTWNDGGTTFTGIGLNVTDTASDASSLLMDLQVGGTSLFKVSKAGLLNVQNALDTGVVISAGSTLFKTIQFGSSIFGSNGTAAVKDGGVIVVRGGGGYYWEAGANNPATGAIDLALTRDAANTLAQRNGTNAQTFNLYNTYTDASNYERGFMKWNSNVLEIGTEAAGTGTARAVKLVGATYFEAIPGNVVFQNGFNEALKLHASYGIAWQAGAATDGTGNTTRLSQGNRSGYGVEVTTGSYFAAPVLEVSSAKTVATLPTTPLVGQMARVTDATAPVVGSTVTGGGAAAALCWYNGTNWTVIGV